MNAEQVLDTWGVADPQRAQLLDHPDIDQVISIYDSLHRIFEEPNQADAWISKPNSAFAGKSGLELMLSGDIEKVGKHLKYHLYSA